MATAEQVREETMKFHAALPGLLEKHRGKWVVFKNGTVSSEHANDIEAYSDGVRKFGVDGGFVVAQVTEVRSTPVTAGVLFGIA
jgi:hypothetical protein